MRPTRNSPVVLSTGAVGLAALLTLWEASTPGPSYWVLPLALYWLALATAWLIRMAVPSPGRWAWAPWMLIPLALALLTALLVKADAPLHVRFALSEPSLERFARSAHTDHRHRWVGLYRVRSMEKIPGGAKLRVTSLTLNWLSYDFAYSPNRPPAEGNCERFKDPWYICAEGE